MNMPLCRSCKRYRSPIPASSLILCASFGEVAEQVEGAPLLREYGPNKSIEGSNPSLSAKSPSQTGNSAKISHPGSKKVRTGDIENLLRSLLVPALTWLAVECAVWVGGWVKRGFKVEIQ